MKIGDEVYVHGYIDEIRNDVIIIRNDGGYFGTAPSEVVEQEETLQNLTKPNKSDLISRQAAISHVDDVPYIKEHPNVGLLWKAWIEQLPSAQPERKKGKWIDVDVMGMPAQACDQCNTFFPLAYTGGGHHYCPNCGAKMEE